MLIISLISIGGDNARMFEHVAFALGLAGGGGVVFTLLLVDSSNDGDCGTMWGGQEQCLQDRGVGH